MAAEAHALALSAYQGARLAPHPSAGAKVLYLGLTGVLHPCPALYRAVFDKSAWDAGHQPYEAAEVLERVLDAWPRVSIVLTSREVWSKGLHPVLRGLGENLTHRVIADTYTDLVVEQPCAGEKRDIDSKSYWALSKAEIVRRHIKLTEPENWVAIDDDGSLWTTSERRSHVVLTDGVHGLLDRNAEERLWLVMLSQFGFPRSHF